MSRMFETVIIGAGVAGLTAGTYLGRFRRPSLVIDGGDSRARWIPESHNTPGFPNGVGGPELLRRLRAQAERYGTEIRPGLVRSVAQTARGFVIETEGGDTLEARFVLLATGVRDRQPEMPGAADAVLRGLFRMCPICDGFEAIGKHIAVIGQDDKGAREAEFLTTYSDRVTLVHIGEPLQLAKREQLRTAGITVLEAMPDQLRLEQGVLKVEGNGGNSAKFDCVYLALGCSVQNSLAIGLGAACDKNDALLVNSHQESSIAGLYAAGDVVRGLNQIVVAAAEAAIAATDIHNRLRSET